MKTRQQILRNDRYRRILLGEQTNDDGGSGGGDPYWSDVVLLVDFDGADDATTETDASASAHTLTFGGTTKLDNVRGASRTGQATSLLCNGGSSDNVRITTATPDLNFGSGDFTIELDVYMDNAWNAESNVLLSANTGHWTVQKISGNSYGSLRFGINDGTTRVINTVITTGTPAAAEWHTIAVSRVGTNVYLLLDGNLESTTDITVWGAMAAGDKTLFIGTNWSTSFDEHDGAIGNIRITKGTGRYTDSYTVSTDPYPTS